MKKRILVGAVALALMAGTISSAMAYDHKGGKRSHAGRVHRPAGQNYVGTPNQSGFIDLGPLGMTLSCGGRPCSTGYSVSAWSY